MVRIPKLFDPIAKEDPAGYAKGVLKNRFRKGLEVAIGDHKYDPMIGERDYGLYPWENSAKKFGEPDTRPLEDPIAETAAYGAGRLAGTFVNDSLRSWWWRWNAPLAIAVSAGRAIPKKAGLVNHRGEVNPVAATLAGFGVQAALDIGSGNTDITNFDEGGRPKGYSALLASPEDPTKSTNLALEVPIGYITGRKGKLLPYEQFAKERPDVSPEEYEEYKRYTGFNTPGLFGLEKADPLATTVVGAALNTVPQAMKGERSARRLARRGAVGAIAGAFTPAAADLVSRMGILKGTWDNLEDQPEAQLLGYKVPLTGALIAGGVGAGIYGLQKHRAGKIQQAVKAEESRLKQVRIQNELNAAKALKAKMPEFLAEMQTLSPAARAHVNSQIANDYRKAKADFARSIENRPSVQQKELWAGFEDNPLGWVEGLDPDIQKRLIQDAKKSAARRANDDYLAGQGRIEAGKNLTARLAGEAPELDPTPITMEEAEALKKTYKQTPLILSKKDREQIDKVLGIWSRRTGAYVAPDMPDFL